MLMAARSKQHVENRKNRLLLRSTLTSRRCDGTQYYLLWVL